jgi:hypothetical protein
MKSLPLVALILAAFCTGAAITAYVLIGRSDDNEPPRVLSRQDTAAESAPVVLGAPSASLPSITPAPQVPLARRSSMTNLEAVASPPAQAAVLQQSPQPSIPIGSPGAQAQFYTRIHAAAGIPRSKSARFGVSASPSDRATPVANRNDTQHATPTKSTNPKSATPALPPVETSTPQTSIAGSETAFRPSNPAPRKRAPWPRGNFSIEDERARAQMGWQAFADEIFDASLNPPVNGTAK